MADKGPSLSNVLSAIKAAVISRPEGILEDHLDADYKELMGSRIPYRKLGYASLEQLISEEKSLSILIKNGLRYVIADKSKASHVASLIASQKKHPPRKKKNAALQRMFNLNAPRPYSKGGGTAYSRTSGKGTKSKGSTRIVKIIPEPPKVSNGPSNSRASYPPSTSQCQPLFRPTRSTSSRGSHQTSAASSSNEFGMCPAGGESEASYDDYEYEEEYTEEPYYPSRQISKSTPKQPQSKSRPGPVSNSHTFIQSNAESSVPTVKPSGAPLPASKPSLTTSVNKYESTESLSQPVMPDQPTAPFVATVPVPVDLNEINSNSNEYIRRGAKRGGRIKRHVSGQKLSSFIDNSAATSGSFTEAFLSLVTSNGWPEPDFRLLPRKLSNNTEIFASTVTGTAILHNSRKPVSYDYSTFPDEYFDRFDSKEAVSKKALEGIMVILEESKNLAPVSDNFELIVNRILSIVLPHSNGIWAFQLEKLYKEKYQEQLPSEWVQEIVLPCAALIAEKLADFSYVVRVNPGTKPIPESDYKRLDVMALGELEYPATSNWDIFVTSVVSPSEVWFRFVGPEYSAWYDEVMEAMAKHYLEWASLIAPKVEVGAVYAYPGQELVARVEVIRINGTEAVVRHVDHGDVEVVPKSHLCVLDLNFRDLPPQALRASAKGLEEFAEREETTLLLAERAQGQVLVSVPSFSDTNDPPVSLVLHDTSGEEPVNINDFVYETLQMDVWNEPTLCEVGSISEVTITSVWKTGDVYCQVSGEGPAWLAAELAALPDSELHPTSISDINVDSLYAVKHSSGQLRRVQLISPKAHGEKVDVCYIDYGDVESVNICQLVPLDYLSPVLCKVPKQAIQLTLAGVSVGGSVAGHLLRLVPPGTLALAKVITTSGLSHPNYTVELFIRKATGDIVSINATVLLGGVPSSLPASSPDVRTPNEATLKAAASMLLRPFAPRRPEETTNALTVPFSSISLNPTAESSIAPAPTPNYEEYFDIYVVCVANPSNFTVIPWKFLKELHVLQEELTEFYNQLPPNDSEYSLKHYQKGTPCTIKHSDGYWYRAIIERVLPLESSTQLVLRFCDFGNMTVCSPEIPRLLKKEFLVLPGLGFRACLHNIKPAYGDWSIEDCERVSELLLEKSLSSVIKGTQMSDGVMSLTLQVFDTSAKEDIDISEVLITENRAVKQ